MSVCFFRGPGPAVPVRDKRDLAAKAKARIEATIRAGRLVWTAAVISADYIAYDVSKVLALKGIDDHTTYQKSMILERYRDNFRDKI